MLYKGFFILLIACVLSSCEDVVDVKLDEGVSQLVVDAWLTNEAKPQHIHLTQSKAYFQSGLGQPVADARVQVTDNDGQVFDFVDPERDGIYTWSPAPGNKFGSIGNSYTLEVRVGDDTYFASSSMNRVPAVDSLVFTFEEGQIGFPDGYYGEFFARDPVGPGDTYWIKTYKNGQFLNKPSEINIAYDAGFSAGGNVDGLIFIPPIRFGINRVPDDSDTDSDDTNDVPPYAPGDSVYVAIHSITQEAYYFWEQARTQMTNEGIFAVPLANVPTNIVHAEGEVAVERQALGFFCVSAVSGLGDRVRE